MNKKLLAAKREAAAIERWLAAPVAKAATLRGQKVKQVNTLNNQVIPALAQQIAFAHNRALALQQLSQLAEQIDGKAEIRYVLETVSGDRAP